MKALFNGHCVECKQFKPRCATVFLRTIATGAVTVCEDCRKGLRGQYRVHPKHKGK